MLNSEKDPTMTREGMAAKYGVSEKQIQRLGTKRMAAMTEDARLVLTNFVKREAHKLVNAENLRRPGKSKSIRISGAMPPARNVEQMLRLALIAGSKRKGMGCAA
jgi:hypothetical protein